MDGRAHMTKLLRTKQGPFTLDDCLQEDQWSFDAIVRHISLCSRKAGIEPETLKPAFSYV